MNGGLAWWEIIVIIMIIVVEIYVIVRLFKKED